MALSPAHCAFLPTSCLPANFSGVDRRRLGVGLRPAVRRLEGALLRRRPAREHDVLLLCERRRERRLARGSEVDHRERLRRGSLDGVSALRGFVVTRRRDEGELDLAAPRLVHRGVGGPVVVHRVRHLAQTARGLVDRRQSVLRLLERGLGLVLHQRHHPDGGPGDAPRRGAAVVGRCRRDAVRTRALRDEVEHAPSVDGRRVALRVLECSFGAHPGSLGHRSDPLGADLGRRDRLAARRHGRGCGHHRDARGTREHGDTNTSKHH